MAYIGIDAKKDIRLNATSDLELTSDNTTIKFGADDDVILTHVHNTGLTLNSTNKMMFNDASQFIQGSSATVLSLGATDEIDLTATTIDMNGAVDVSGNATFGGDITLSSASSPEIKIAPSDATAAFFKGDSNRSSAGQHLTEFQGHWNGTQVARIVVAAGDDTTNKDDGHLDFYTTPSGGSSTRAMRIKSDGNIGIGTTSPAQKLTVASEGRLRLQRSDNTRYADIYNDNSFLNIVTSNDPIKLDGQSYIRFDVGGSEHMRINSDGALMVATTDLSAYNNNAGSTADNGLVYDTYAFSVARYNGTVSYLNRTGSSDGTILELRKNGGGIGTLGYTSSGFYIDGEANHIGLRMFASTLGARLNGSDNDGDVDLGWSGGRFKNLYLSGGAYIGGTGSANYLDDYEEGTWTPVYQMTGTAFSSITHDVQIGTYTKVGRLVTVNFGIRTSALTKGSASGDVTIAGLPFANNSATAVGPVVHAAQDGWITTVPNAGWARSDSTIYLSYIIGGTSTTYGGITINNMSTGSAKNRTYGSATYET